MGIFHLNMIAKLALLTGFTGDYRAESIGHNTRVNALSSL